MNTAPITAAPTDMSGLPPPTPPSAPGTPSFSDMLASATSSLAAFALLPTSATDALGNTVNLPPAPKRDPNNDNAAAPIALPTPVQPPPATTNSASTGSSSTAPTQTTSTAGGTQQSQQSASPATATSSGSAGTGGTSSGSAQTTNGATLPPMAAELNAKIALGAQALLSQPSQVLATLPHGAPPTAAALAQSASTTAHGSTAPDPAAVLPKLAASATVAAATPENPAPTLDAALQSAAVQTSSTTAEAESEATVLANASDPTAQTGADTGAGTTPALAAVPVPITDAAQSLENAPPPAVASSALDQVAANLTQGSKLGLSQIEIQLKPASLGAVDVKLELTHDGRVTAVISADRSDTLMQLQRGSGELQQALRDAGLHTDSGSLSFNLRGDAQTSDQSGRQPSYATPQPTVTSGSGDDLLAVPLSIAGASQSSHNGLLNIQV